MILQALKHREKNNKPITVGLIGAGCMGKGICHQVSITPGMELRWIADINLDAAESAASTVGCPKFSTSALDLMDSDPVDVLVESSNTVKAALEYCSHAIKSGSHVVLMNAEVDLAYGEELVALANEHNVVVTSDAGDQHGVLATMIEEITLWGFEMVQAGNIKGFLNQYATADELIHEAAKRNLNPVQCCAYTDGTKLNIEMAVLANALGYLPTKIGMVGPKAQRVEEVLDLFNFEKQTTPSVDYILGAEPGGGVYVVAKCDHPVQTPYLEYYKLGDAPYYLFFRPYHLCHLETTTAIAKAVLFHTPILQTSKRITDVYAIAKSQLTQNKEIHHGIGSDEFYGLIAPVEEAEKNHWVPIHTLDECTHLLKTPLEKDQYLTKDQIELLP
ncbi:homoserine dehydrogenase [Akkermansiaceae bacterium]|nr:homoserine dehydrogenase [Akkermansiaceae bacterium]